MSMNVLAIAGYFFLYIEVLEKFQVVYGTFWIEIFLAIKNILIKFLVDEEILDPSALSSSLITQTDLQLRELEVQRQIQLEKLRLEQEERKLERD